MTLQILTFDARDAVPGDLVSDHDVKLENEVKTEEFPVADGSLPPTVLDVGSQSCKDEPQDSKEDAMPYCAGLYSVGTISVSRCYCGLQSFITTAWPNSTFAMIVPPLPSAYPLLQSNSDVRTLTHVFATITSWTLSSPVPRSPPHPPPTSPSSPYSVTPTVPCVRESRLSVDVLTFEPWTSLGATPRDSFSRGLSLPSLEAPVSPPSPHSISPTFPDVPSLGTDTAVPLPNVDPSLPSPPSPSTSSIDISPSRPVLVDNSSPSRTGGYIPPRAIF